MRKRLPEFHTEADEAAFWDRNDVAGFLAELDEDCDTVFVRPEAGVVELGKETWQELARVARRRRTTPAQLLRRWLREKLREHRPAR